MKNDYGGKAEVAGSRAETEEEEDEEEKEEDEKREKVYSIVAIIENCRNDARGNSPSNRYYFRTSEALDVNSRD